jgi:hypothetical protein
VWQKLKEDDKQRKEVAHVSHADATAITGYGEGGRKMGKEDGKGDKRSLGALFFG